MTKKFYAPKGHKARVRPAPREPVRVPEQSECEVVRFVLKSAQHLDLQLETVEEITDYIGGEQCMCICGCKASGERVIVPWNNVDYIEEMEAC